MKRRTARILSFVSGLALLMFMISTSFSFVTLFILGTVTGIASSETTLGISHEAVVEVTQFAMKMFLPIELFMLIIAYAVSNYCHDKIHAMIMRRVPEETRSGWRYEYHRKRGI